MIEFRILGSLEVVDQGRLLVLGSPRQRALLGVLLVHRGEPVSSDRLVDELWGERAPASAIKIVQGYVSNLRKVLGDGLLVTRGRGYSLQLDAGRLDVDRFEAWVAEGRRVMRDGDARTAATRLREALALWRGPPLADFVYESFAQAEIARLEEFRLGALEDGIDADLASGEHARLVGELEGLVHKHPLRERLWGQLMLALYRSGRQADALQAYRDARRRLVDELGLEPGPQLADLEHAILEQDDDLRAPVRDSDRAAASLAGGAQHRRDPRKPPGGAAPPLPPTRTIGRDEDLGLLGKLLLDDATRLLTLVGPGGVGKTRLALTLARTVDAEFPDGICWVDLSGVAHSDHVATAIARVLDLTPETGETAEDALRRHLAGRRILLVLDNFEHVLDASSLVANLLSASSGPVVLATSREPLNIAAEQRYSVDVLELPAQPERATVAEVESAPATAMFLDAVRRRDRRFTVAPSTAPKIAHFCAQLDGLPLALELAAARVGLLGLPELTEWLDATTVDPALAPRDAPDRQKTLPATVEWSYRLLDENEQRCFVRFAVFAGGASLDAAEVATGAPTRTLHALIAKNLLAKREHADGHSRLLMLQTIRDHALRRFLEDPEQRDVRRRHHDYYKRLVNRTVPRLSTHEEPTALQVLDVEIENIHIALGWALENDPKAALQVAGNLSTYWRTRRDRAGLTWLKIALAGAPDAPATDRARAKLGLAHHLFLHARYDEFPDAAFGALELYQEAGDDAGTSAAFRDLAAHASIVTDDSRKAREYAEASCRHARIAGDDALLGRALSWLAPQLEGERRTAVLHEAASLLAKVGDHRELAQMYTNAACRDLTANRPADALPLLRLALPEAEKLTTVSTKTFVLGNIGLAQLLVGNLDEARAAFESQLQLWAGQPFRIGPDEALAGLAAISAHQGQLEKAARLLGAARALGYPNTPADEPIHARLDREYLAGARHRYGAEAWRRAEQAGADLSYDDAVALAIGHHDFRRSGSPHDKEVTKVPADADTESSADQPRPYRRLGGTERREHRLRPVD